MKTFTVRHCPFYGMLGINRLIVFASKTNLKKCTKNKALALTEPSTWKMLKGFQSWRKNKCNFRRCDIMHMLLHVSVSYNSRKNNNNKTHHTNRFGIGIYITTKVKCIFIITSIGFHKKLGLCFAYNVCKA